MGALVVGPPSDKPASEHPSSADPPGGYWTFAEAREREGEPRDGEDELTLGAVLFSLGALRAGAAGVTLWMAGNPQACPVDKPEQCNGMRLYGYAGFGEGGLMLTTGIVYLAIGATHRQRYQRWKRGESISRRVGMSPWMLGSLRDPNGGGLTFSLRF